MRKTHATEDALRVIKEIRDAPQDHDLKRELAPFLQHRSNHVVAAAAETVERLESSALGPDLIDAFLDLMDNPSVDDPGCKALTAIAKALAAMGQTAPKVYFAGIRHIQREGSYGPPVDAAAALRGICAQGLARTSDPEALTECVTLLADPQTAARVGAVRAIGETGQPAGVLLLRFKAMIGDEDDGVITECLSALLGMAPKESLEFVAKFLRGRSDEVAERAALALGESRLPEAFPLLRSAWEQRPAAGLRRTFLLSIALLRQDEAVEFLLSRLDEEPEQTAADVLGALTIYARDDKVRDRVDEILQRRRSFVLSGIFQREWRR